VAYGASVATGDAIELGSDAPKELFCRTFLEAHRRFEPAELPWPDLGADDLAKLRAIPFWDEALGTEQEAGPMVGAAAEASRDPLVREAIALQAYEEARHGRLIRHLLDRYGIDVPDRPAPALTRDPERAFVDFGYDECLDAFGAFGLFALARRAAYLPRPFFDIFDRVLDEEAQHIVFFVNWIAWRAVRDGRRDPVRRSASALWHYGKSLTGRLRMVFEGGGDSQDAFVATGAKTFLDDLTASLFLETCLLENARRMSVFDARLLQPRLLPTLARAGLRTLRLVPGKRL
jgi:hypothetical protein